MTKIIIITNMKKISLLLVCLAMIFASCSKNGKKGGNAEGSVAYQRDLTEEEIQFLETQAE